MKALPTVTTEGLFDDLPPAGPPMITERTIWHVGVSGGKDSAALLLWLVRESGIDPTRIRASFCDIGNDHPWTLEHVALLSEKVHLIKTIYPEESFFDLVKRKRIFPSVKARYCTELLKIAPSAMHTRRLKYQGFDPISASSTRTDESDERAKLHEWDYSGTLLCVQRRPLIRWALEDVFAIHRRHNLPLNPLYAMGARRVGCWPCVMSSKEEVRMIALKNPERIDQIRAVEQRMSSATRGISFFRADKVPARFHTGKTITSAGEEITYPTIDDVVHWSMTGDRAQGSWEDQPQPEVLTCKSRFCE